MLFFLSGNKVFYYDSKKEESYKFNKKGLLF
jgi:hypothetical protein